MKHREVVVFAGVLVVLFVVWMMLGSSDGGGESRMTESELQAQQQRLSGGAAGGMGAEQEKWQRTIDRASAFSGAGEHGFGLSLQPTAHGGGAESGRAPVKTSFGRFSTVETFDERTDADWIPAMEKATISHVESFKPNNAYSDKYLVTLPGGKKAMLKLVEKHSLFDRGVPTVSFDPVKHEGAYRAESGKYQGMPELVAFHVDRILGFFRKPPIVGRVVDSSLLWSSWWNAWLPSYEVPVTLHAWVEGLVTRYPALELYDFLTFEGHIQENAKILSYAADISDTLVFDFLVDDHDRKAEKNWVEFTKDGRLTHWDSGLAFNHGPVGDGFCLDILCGPNVWRRTRMGLTGRAQCDRICRFRTSTVERLRNIHDATDEHVKLSYRLKQALSESVLFPAFHYGVYYSDRREVELVRFESDEFFAGLDERLGRILGHIDGCVRAYGDAALIDV